MARARPDYGRCKIVIAPAEVELSLEDFLRIARAMFEATDDTLVQLYPMVHDLRALAAHVSQVAMNEPEPLSETATGE